MVPTPDLSPETEPATAHTDTTYVTGPESYVAGPEPYYYSAPEVVGQDAANIKSPDQTGYAVLHNSQYIEQMPGNAPQYNQPQDGFAAGGAEPGKIIGLRRTTFVLSVLLVAVIIMAAVGGGVGGSIAVQNAKNACPDTPPPAYQIATSTVTVTANPTPTTGSPTGSASPSGTSAEFTAPTDVVVALDCPTIDTSTQVITLGDHISTFQINCNTDYNGQGIDIVAVTVYSLRDCMRSCASYNLNSNTTNCAAVEFAADLDAVVPNDYGNCFLKFGTGEINKSVDNIHAGAVLVSSK